MRIGIVGLGRLGRSLRALLGANGWEIDARGRYDGWPDTPVVLLTVPDGAIASVAALLPPGPIVLHCSGACGLDVLDCLLYTSPSPRDRTRSRMPSSA